MKKLKVAILFGGKSAEHEVSLQSAGNILEALDKNKYEPVLIGIDKSGRWHMKDHKFLLAAASDYGQIVSGDIKATAAVMPGGAKQLLHRQDVKGIDVVFPILHGPFGEDGTIQGLLKLADIPFVGSGVLGSAVGMDKDITKRLLREAGIPVADFVTVAKGERISFDRLKEKLGLPFFIKPANLGSSIGVHKVKSQKEFKSALADALSFDNKVLAEKYIRGREIECSVLGNEDPVASVPGEVVSQHDFYSYEAKYLDENGAMLKIPADLPKISVKVIQSLAVKTFKTLGCDGMARVDFFLNNRGQFFVNEINTIPGFTKISMYPKLWEASGVSYSQLIDRLIDLAIKKYKRNKNLKTSR